MTSYYNEIDPYAAQWLRNLIEAGLIAPGHVDERSIVDVRPADLDGFEQCHFFAGIGGWSAALRLAAWPDAEPVWSGSCPCQPLSGSGQRKGHADERHLWPAFYGLIAECKPTVVFGEQVTGPDGMEWLSGVRADLEAAGYAIGAADLCAAGVSSPQNRPRFFWMAHARGQGVPRSIEQRAGLRSTAGAAPAEPRDSSIRPWLFDCSNPNSISAVDGLRRPVGEVRAFGNAIVPQVAAEFIKATQDALTAA